MAETDMNEAERPESADRGISLSVTCLKGEIAFWRDMIESRSEALPPEAAERMQHALALAERRLEGLLDARRHAAVSNIYPLDPSGKEAIETGHESNTRPVSASGQGGRSLN